MYAKDLDGDTDVDIIVASYPDDKIAWYENLLIADDIKKNPPITAVNFQLYNNYPNPFNPETHIEFDVEKNSHVVLKVYDLYGREVTTLVNERLPAGHYESTFNGQDLASGIYFYQIRMGDFHTAKKMMLIR